jgi:hypothetical protein
VAHVRKSAEYTTSAFRFHDGKLTLATMTEPLDIVWSGPCLKERKIARIHARIPTGAVIICTRSALASCVRTKRS